MMTQQAWSVIEMIMAGRINRAANALELTADLGVNQEELLSKMKLEREALWAMREHMAKQEQGK